MNWQLLFLPAVASLSLLAGAWLFYLSVKSVSGVVPVPRVLPKEPDITVVKEAFSRVFPQTTPPVRKEGKSATQNVELLGVSIGTLNMALLKAEDETLVLREGESAKGITLRKVARESATLLINGKEITLKVKTAKATLSPATAGGESGFSEVRLSRRDIQRITRDPGIMFREIRLVPYVRGGRTKGFIFEWIKPGSLFYRAGLRKGDILLSINNRTIRSAEDAFRLLQLLRNESSLRIVLLRKGQRREINVRIE